MQILQNNVMTYFKRTTSGVNTKLDQQTLLLITSNYNPHHYLCNVHYINKEEFQLKEHCSDQMAIGSKTTVSMDSVRPALDIYRTRVEQALAVICKQ